MSEAKDIQRLVMGAGAENTIAFITNVYLMLAQEFGAFQAAAKDGQPDLFCPYCHKKIYCQTQARIGKAERDDDFTGYYILLSCPYCNELMRVDVMFGEPYKLPF